MNISVVDPFGVAGDCEMPLLAQAIQPDAAQFELRKCLHKQTGAMADDDVKLLAIRVTRYKPNRRCVIEYDVSANRQVPITLIGKARRKRFGNADYRLLHSVWQAGFDDASQDGLSVAAPVGVLGGFEMWVQRKVPGIVATHLLAAADSTRLAHRVAEAAFKLHAATDQIPTDRLHTMADELRILRTRLVTVASQHPAWAKRIQAIWVDCEALGAAVVPITRGIHRDFYSDQIIVCGNRLHLIDFDLYCRGDVGVDIGNFMGHIAEQSLRELGDTAALQHVERALESRYVDLAGEQVRHAIHVYRHLTLARHISLSNEITDRQHLTMRLMDLCEKNRRTLGL